MPKRIPLPCTPENCGDLFAKCGSASTYSNLGCRCNGCYEANQARCRGYRKANREKLAEYERSRRDSRQPHSRDYIARYNEVNRERHREYQREHYIRNRENKAEYARKYYAENRDACRERNRKWTAENPENIRTRARRHSATRRALKLATAVVPFTAEQVAQRMSYYGNRCYIRMDGVCTGAFDDVDHVKPLSKGGAHMLSNLRPACEPCNSRKHNRWPFPLK
jgi:5-methylcytosine-specific restriction endonuclease McrA